MIDYEEELKKFEPCLDVTDAEGAIYDRELTDILDVLQEVLREAKSNNREGSNENADVSYQNSYKERDYEQIKEVHIIFNRAIFLQLIL